MKNVTFIARNELTLVTDSGEVTYPRGAMVQFECDESGDAYITYHEEDESGKIHVFELDLDNKQILEAFLENVLVKEIDLEDTPVYEEVSLDELIIEEGISPKDLACMLTEASFRKKRVVRKGKLTTRRVRVSRKPIRTARQKASDRLRGKKVARNIGARRKRLKSFRKGQAARLHDSFLDMDFLFNNSLDYAITETAKVVESALGERAKVFVKENCIKVHLLQSEEKELIEALDQSDFNWKMEGEDLVRTITFFKPEDSPVVESIYNEEDSELDELLQTEIDDKDDKDDEDEDEMDDEDDDKEEDEKDYK